MENWIKIASFTYPHEAHLAKSLLEASEIEVIIKDELTVQVHNFLSNAIGGVKLFIREEDKEEALLLLQKTEPLEEYSSDKKEEIKTFSDEYKDVCPYCEGNNVEKKNIPGYIFVLSILLLGFPFPFLKRTHFCYDCSKEWRIKKGDSSQKQV